jgi:hypothetical protein
MTVMHDVKKNRKAPRLEVCGWTEKAVILMGAVVLLALPGCLSLGSRGDSDTSKNVAETAIEREVAEMVKLYRMCLQKNEDAPVKAKENCGMYRDAIRDLSPGNMRTIVADVVDRLRDKCEKAANHRESES